jgi:uncharacterized membrane protein
MLLLRRGEGGAPLRPQLIAFHDMTPVQAIRWSVYAAIANLVPLIVYGFTLVALMVLGAMTWGLGFLVVIPMMGSAPSRLSRVFESAAP